MLAVDDLDFIWPSSTDLMFERIFKWSIGDEREQSMQSYPKIRKDWTEWYKFIVVVTFSSRLANSCLFKLKA